MMVKDLLSWRPSGRGPLSLLLPRANRTRLAVVAAGFFATLAVIAVVIGISLYSMGQIRASLERLAEHVQRQLVEVATMREYLYLRIVSSRDMLLMSDPFDIDAEAQRFYTYPARIDAAYQRFRALAGDPVEIALADKFMVEARLGLPLLNDVINQLLARRRLDEILPLVHRAFQTQKLGLETLLALQDRLQEQGVRLAQQAVSRYETTRLVVIALTALAVLLVLGISVIMAVLLEQHTADLDREHRKFKTLFDGSRDAVMILTAGTITEYNQRALDWFDQLGAGAPAGRRLEELARHGTPGETTLPPARLDEALAGPDGGTVEWVLRDRRGEPLHAELTLTPLPGSGPDQHQLVVRDVTARVVEFRRVSHDAAHDALTGIPNRREFERRAGLAVRAAVRDGARHVLCFLDLDGFKPVNDRAGHAAGDELLRQVATRLRAHARSGDLLARIGGDEFGLLLEDCPLDHGAQIVRAIIRDIGAMPFHAAGQDFRVGVSIGLAAITRDTPGLEALMAAADQACYAAKRDPTHLVLAHSG